MYGKGTRIRAFSHILNVLVYLFLIAGFFYLRNVIVGITVTDGNIGLAAILSHLRTIPELAYKFLVPLGLSPMPGFRWFNAIAGILILAGLFLISLKVKPVTGKALLFGLTWFLLFLAPSLVFVNKYGSNAFDYMEHRGYLPLAGILFFVSTWITENNARKGMRYLTPVLSVIVVVFGIYAHLYSRNYKDAVSFFTRAVESNPSSSVAWFCRGTVLILNRQDYPGAIEDLNRALKLDPLYGQAYLNRGFCREQLTDYGGALSDYRKAAEIDPTTYEPHAAMALLYNSKGIRSEALDEFDKALELNPTFSAGFYQRAVLRSEAGDYQGAIEDFGRAILLEPGNAEAYVNRGVVKFQVQEYLSAIEDFDFAIHLNDKLPEAWLNRGRVHYYAREYDLARSDWEMALKLGNKDAESLLRTYFPQ